MIWAGFINYQSGLERVGVSVKITGTQPGTLTFSRNDHVYVIVSSKQNAVIIVNIRTFCIDVVTIHAAAHIKTM